MIYDHLYFLVTRGGFTRENTNISFHVTKVIVKSTLVKLKIHALPNTFTRDKFLLKTFENLLTFLSVFAFWPPS